MTDNPSDGHDLQPGDIVQIAEDPVALYIIESIWLDGTLSMRKFVTDGNMYMSYPSHRPAVRRILCAIRDGQG